MEIKQNEHEVFICQKKYAKEILKKFKLEECKEMTTPMNSKEKLCKEDGYEGLCIMQVNAISRHQIGFLDMSKEHVTLVLNLLGDKNSSCWVFHSLIGRLY